MLSNHFEEDVPDEMGLSISERLSSRLLNGITRSGIYDIKEKGVI